MGNTYRPKKATFTATIVKGQRVFTPVNKRAKFVAKKAGKRTKVTLADLRRLKGSGTYRYFAYNKEGELQPIRL